MNGDIQAGLALTPVQAEGSSFLKNSFKFQIN